eukprot:1158981-Pelagomonas_calceolata.AAC.3
MVYKDGAPGAPAVQKLRLQRYGLTWWRPFRNLASVHFSCTAHSRVRPPPPAPSVFSCPRKSPPPSPPSPYKSPQEETRSRARLPRVMHGSHTKGALVPLTAGIRDGHKGHTVQHNGRVGTQVGYKRHRAAQEQHSDRAQREHWCRWTLSTAAAATRRWS